MRVAPVIFVLSALAAASVPLLADETVPPVSFHLQQSVAAGDQQLAPGDYTIKQLPNSPGIFAIYGKDGTTFETFLMSQPVEYAEPVNKTDVTLRNDGGTYVLDHMQIEGRDLGYEFGTPQALASRDKERAGN